jgi:HEAT repeat protein
MRAICLLLGIHIVAAACAAAPCADVALAQTAQVRSTVELDAGRDTIAQLAAKGDRQSCQALLPFLADADEDLRNRAAQAVYDRCADPATLPGIEGALRRCLELGTSVAGAYLLLGRVPGPESIAALQPFADGTQLVKLHPWTSPVSVALPASVALLRAGQARARDRVMQATGTSLAETVFLLHVLADVEDPSALKSATALIDDRREISEGVPSGATPRRRVADLAVDSLASRLQLKIGFTLSSSARYSEANLKEVRAAADAVLSK